MIDPDGRDPMFAMDLEAARTGGMSQSEIAARTQGGKDFIRHSYDLTVKDGVDAVGSAMQGDFRAAGASAGLLLFKPAKIFSKIKSIFKGTPKSPSIDPKDVANKTPTEIDTFAKDNGLVPKRPNPKAGQGAYTDPATGNQRVLCHPNCGSGNPHAHVNDAARNRLDINGNQVPAESAAAHLPITPE